VESLTLLPPPDAVISDSENSVPPLNPASAPHTFRVLTAEEVATLAPLFEGRGASLPNPETSFFVGAVDDHGKIHGWIVVQAVIHAEPMYIENGYSALFAGIAHQAEQEIAQRLGTTTIFLFTPRGRVAQLAESCGMHAEPWVVFAKTIAGQVPVVPVVPVVTEPEPEPAEPAEPVALVPEPEPEENTE
jgi:hypothetical protein